MFRRRFNVGTFYLLLIAFPAIVFSQTTTNDQPDFVPSVSFSEVLKGLADESVSSLFDRNRDLSKAVDDRGVGFALSANTRIILVNAGAKEGLLSAIERKQKQRTEAIVRLSKEYREAFNDGPPTIQGRRKVIALGRELLDRIGDPNMLEGKEQDLREMASYLKEALPKMEMRLRKMLDQKSDVRFPNR